MTATVTPQPADPTAAERPRHVRVGILGAGFGGLGMAIRLKQAGIDDFVVWERDAEVGGTWWANTLPRLPVRHPLAPLLVLVRPQPGLEPHLSAAARDEALPARLSPSASALREHIRLGLRGARRGVGRGRRRLAGRRPRRGRSPSDLLIAAPGFLSEPVDARACPASTTSRATTFHTARWNHDHDLTGRRVAVIGTGASAIQAVPADPADRRAPRRLPAHTAVGHAPPRPADHRHRARALPPLPGRRSAPSAPASTSGRELLVPGFVYRPKLMRLAAARRAAPPREAGRRPRAARAADARLLVRLQARPAVQRLVPGDHAAQRRASSPTASRDVRRERHRRRADGDAARGRHDRLRDRLPRDRRAVRQTVRGRDGR